MLVGVLISIMISIVVGVNLIPTIITSINTARAQAEAVEGFSGLGGLMEVLASTNGGLYEVTHIANRSNSVNPKSFGTRQYRAKQGSNSWACVETRWATPLGVMV